ncbi:hypothetical protein [Leptospira meyeri]|uniref:hypothetical protein n=1 Tax=Leptospira meyeri TaxID=29508 RepID=UPI00055A2D18|nr:hypothetical protein [Leptospira meyeri]
MDIEEKTIQENANNLNLLNIYINLMQQTETKLMTTIGFYFAGIIALFSSSNFTTNRTFVFAIAIILGFITSYIAGSFRSWKREYLFSAQKVISTLNNFQNLDESGRIPASLKNQIERPDIYSIDLFLVYTPLILTTIFFLIELHLQFYYR